MPETVTFYLLAGLAVVASALVIGQRNPMYSVMFLIVSFAALAGLYIQLDAPFVAVAQIIIYAGAIMVLFLFVVMLLNAPQEDAAEWDRSHPLRRSGMTRVGAVLAGVLILQLSYALMQISELEAPVGVADGAGDGEQRARAGQGAVRPARVCLRGDVGADSGGDGRRRRPRAPGRARS